MNDETQELPPNEDLLVADATYEIYTPYNSEAAQTLWEVLQATKTDKGN